MDPDEMSLNASESLLWSCSVKSNDAVQERSFDDKDVRNL
jgi:hypothetical protein